VLATKYNALNVSSGIGSVKIPARSHTVLIGTTSWPIAIVGWGVAKDQRIYARTASKNASVSFGGIDIGVVPDTDATLRESKVGNSMSRGDVAAMGRGALRDAGLEERCIPAARRGKWSAVQVARRSHSALPGCARLRRKACRLHVRTGSMCISKMSAARLGKPCCPCLTILRACRCAV
jgi:hypothetical protein